MIQILVYATLIVSLINFATLMLLFYYVNRNWEKHLEHKNQLNFIEKVLFIRGWRDE